MHESTDWATFVRIIKVINRDFITNQPLYMHRILMQSQIFWPTTKNGKKNYKNFSCLSFIRVNRFSWNNLANLTLSCLIWIRSLFKSVCVHFNCFKLIMSLNYIKSVLHEGKTTSNKCVKRVRKWRKKKRSSCVIDRLLHINSTFLPDPIENWRRMRVHNAHQRNTHAQALK